MMNYYRPSLFYHPDSKWCTTLSKWSFIAPLKVKMSRKGLMVLKWPCCHVPWTRYPNCHGINKHVHTLVCTCASDLCCLVLKLHKTRFLYVKYIICLPARITKHSRNAKMRLIASKLELNRVEIRYVFFLPHKINSWESSVLLFVSVSTHVRWPVQYWSSKWHFSWMICSFQYIFLMWTQPCSLLLLSWLSQVKFLRLHFWNVINSVWCFH